MVPPQEALMRVKWEGQPLLSTLPGRLGPLFVDTTLWRTWVCPEHGYASVSEPHTDPLACIGSMAVMWAQLTESKWKGIPLAGQFWMCPHCEGHIGAFSGVIIVLLDPSFCPGDSCALALPQTWYWWNNRIWFVWPCIVTIPWVWMVLCILRILKEITLRDISHLWSASFVLTFSIQNF